MGRVKLVQLSECCNFVLYLVITPLIFDYTLKNHFHDTDSGDSAMAETEGKHLNDFLKIPIPH